MEEERGRNPQREEFVSMEEGGEGPSRPAAASGAGGQKKIHYNQEEDSDDDK